MALGCSMAPRRLISAVEHDLVLRHSEGAQVLPVDRDWILDLDALRAALVAGPRALVGVQWANSETGVRQPIAEIADIVHAADAILLVDAAQMPARADEAGAAPCRSRRGLGAQARRAAGDRRAAGPRLRRAAADGRAGKGPLRGDREPPRRARLCCCRYGARESGAHGRVAGAAGTGRSWKRGRGHRL